MMEISKDEIADDDDNTPNSTSPPHSHVSSTPCNTGSKPDVAELFQKMGKKLGWFQYDDINTAIKSLSKSAKKKSSKSRCRQDVSGNTSNRAAEISGARECKSSRQDIVSSSHKDSDTMSNGRQKLSFSQDESLSTIQENTNQCNSDSFLKPVPVRKSKASTDLTKEPSGRINKLSLSAKKKQRAVKTSKSDKENLSPEIVPIPLKTKKKTVRISMIPNEIDIIQSGRNQASSTRIYKSSKTDRLSVGDVLMDDPVLESTRIHSRESIARYLPSTSSNRSSVDDLDIGEPLVESTRIHGRESIAKYLPSNRIPSEDVEVGQKDMKSKGLMYAENSLSLGHPVQESTRLYSNSKNDKASGSRSKDSFTDDISAIRNNDTSISLCFNASDTTEMDDDSYKYLKIPGNTLTSCKLSEGSSFNQRSSHVTGGDHQDDVLVNCTELYTTAVGGPEEEVTHNTVFHTICESDQSQGSETDSKQSCSSSVTENNHSDEDELKSENQNDDVAVGNQSKESIENYIPKRNRKNEQSIDNGSEQVDDSVLMMEVRDMSLQTSVHGENISLSDKENEDKVSFYEVQDFSLQVNEKEESSSVSKLHEKDIHNSSMGSRKTSSGSSYLEVEDAGLQTSQFSVDCKASLGNVTENESESDSFDQNLYKSVTVGRADQSPCRAGKHGKHHTVLDDDDESDDDADDDYIPLKDRLKKKDKGGTGHDKDVERDQPEPNTGSTDDSEITAMTSDDYLPDIQTKDDSRKSENTKWRTKEDFNSDSSEDDLETFFQKMRTPLKDKNPSQALKDSSKDDSMDDFIVDDDDVSSGSDDGLFYITTTSKLPSPQKQNKKPDPVICLSSDEDDSVFKTPQVLPKTKPTASKLKTPRKPIPDFVCDSEERFSFLKSLSSNIQDDKCNREAFRFKKNFKKMKEELTGKLYTIYNESIFDNQLPEDLTIIWNKRLLRTAGYCVYKKNAAVKNSNSVRIELSTKVCDSTERVRDTLIHELCHAAVWLLHGRNDGHGPYWRLWAQKANLTHPELPVINRCHSYSIATKYTYQCSKCGYQIGRHSKSLDTKRKVCGYCRGEFVLLSNSSGSSKSASSTPATPRAPNKFALFVKENYGKVKGQQKELKHGDIMKVLSKEFAEKNKIT